MCEGGREVVNWLVELARANGEVGKGRWEVIQTDLVRGVEHFVKELRCIVFSPITRVNY